MYAALFWNMLYLEVYQDSYLAEHCSSAKGQGLKVHFIHHKELNLWEHSASVVWKSAI